MPNWAAGTLKIKGSKEEIFKFCKEKLDERAMSSKLTTDKEKKVEWEMGEKTEREELYATVLTDPNPFIWLKDSQRNFIDMEDTDVPYYWDMDHEEENVYTTTFYLYKMRGNGVYCIIFPFKAAWGAEPDYFASLSKEYDLEFRIHTVEQGMGFFADYNIKKGEVTVLAEGPSMEKTDSPDQWYGQFVWECPFPFIGG